MENRSIFSLHGITGMLIATGLLISILIGLTIWAINVQQANAGTYYQIENAKNLHSCTQFTVNSDNSAEFSGSMAECLAENGKHRKLTVVK